MTHSLIIHRTAERQVAVHFDLFVGLIVRGLKAAAFVMLRFAAALGALITTIQQAYAAAYGTALHPHVEPRHKDYSQPENW